MYEYNAKITNIVDGDTFDLDIDLGFHIHVHERVRILDLDTPETRGAEKELGSIAKNFAVKYFLNCNVTIHSKCEIVPKTDSFGRWLVEVVVQEGTYKNKSVAQVFSDLGINKNDINYSSLNFESLAALVNDTEE